PAGVLQSLLELAFARPLNHLLDETAGAGRRIEEHDTARLAAAIHPGMRHVAGQEGAGARPAGDHFLADLEGELSLQDPSDLVAVTVQMEPAVLGPRGHRLLEQGDALPGLATEQFHGHDLTGRFLEMLPAARGYDEPSGHASLLRSGSAQDIPVAGRRLPLVRRPEVGLRVDHD